jgi:hypothetical protein
MESEGAADIVHKKECDDLKVCTCAPNKSKNSFSPAYVPGRRATWADGIDYLESIPWLIKRLQIRTQVAVCGLFVRLNQRSWILQSKTYKQILTITPMNQINNNN